LPDFIAVLEQAGFSALRHRLQFQSMLSTPVLAMTMALLAAGFPDRIQGLLTALGTSRNFDPATDADPTDTLVGFAGSSVGWLEAKRQTSTQTLGYETALLQRTTAALSNVTGVDINEEMTLMMELERSFNASSTLISTIDRMLEALLQAVR